jgi:hypothetical protein
VREPLTIADMDDLADAIEKVATHAGAIRDAFREESAPKEVFTPLAAANQTGT